MTVKYLKLFWYQIFAQLNLILLDFRSDFVLIFFLFGTTVHYFQNLTLTVLTYNVRYLHY